MRQLDELSSDQKVFIRVLASVLGNASQCYTRVNLRSAAAIPIVFPSAYL